MATNTTRYLTSIPTTQPNCGQLSIDNPSPHCISNSTSDPMGCFVQPTGLYCAPISTTRGFLYDPSSSSSTPANNTNTNPTTTTVPIYINLIPKLSTVTSTNNTLDISGQPVLTKGPAGLGQTCVGIPYPSQTDPSWSLLVTMANKRLNETVGNPGIGAGSEILSLQSDCEPNTYCDFSTSTSTTTDRQGTCKEQLPNYHSCNSYVECISLRCDVSSTDTSTKAAPTLHKRKRSAGTVCLPSRTTDGTGDGQGFGGNDTLIGGGGGGSGGSNEINNNHSFPMWTIALIVIVLLVGGLFAFLWIRRRQRQLQQQQNQPKIGRLREREREREMSMSSINNNNMSYLPTRVSTTSSNNSTNNKESSRIILPKIVTTFSDQLTLVSTSASSPATPKSKKHSSFSSISSSTSFSSTTASPSTLSAASSAPPSPSLPSPSLLSIFSPNNNNNNNNNNSLAPPSPLLLSSPSSLPNSPTSTIPVSPISPISPISPYFGPNSGGTSRLSGRNQLQNGGASLKKT